MSFKPSIAKAVYEYEPEELTNPDITVIFDLDWVKYSSASVGEKRTIIAKHIKSGKTKAFKNRTEFWGRSSKELGGWLGEENAKREEKGLAPFSKEDFETEDVQHPEPLENLIHTANRQVQAILDAVGTSKAEYFIGEGSSWRVEASTLLKYKGQRQELIKPVHLDAVSEYLKNKYKPTVCVGLEADEMILIRYLELKAQGKKAVVAALDKDTYGCPLELINPNKLEEGIVDCTGFGKLWIEGEGTKRKVRGKGRIFQYFQTIYADSVDNYRFNHFSDKKWGEMSAYKALADCEDDKEALEAMIAVAKDLYPEPKTVVGWRGKPITIDASYVLNENFLMSRMLAHRTDFKTFDIWAAQFGVTWDEEALGTD